MNKFSYLFIILTLLPFYGITADTTSYVAGQKLFRKNCSSCHNVHKELTGPMLASITKKRPEEWLISFIKNSQNVILSNDVYADHLFAQYNRTVMPSFEHLSDKEIKNILQFIEAESKIKQVSLEDEDFNYMPGKDLYRNHCMTCHQLNSEDYGPSLGSIYRRRPKEWIIKFVTNSQSVIKGNDPYAEFVYNKFDRKLMPAFNFLDRKSIISIVEYIDAVSKSSPQVAGVNGNKQILTTKAKAISAYKFPDKEPVTESDGLFGKICISALAVITGYILFIILKMLYQELAKSQN